ncbi:uncharacterized protein LOC132267458 [Cornus florida]|uniref:uncharacterized protein LOC132267458 n=1 Tax=Cornus florida TaxID=4283 RepID=UPI00289854DB|nr:uncharacterized protein LOC132267458 [Cornus florida]
MVYAFCSYDDGILLNSLEARGNIFWGEIDSTDPKSLIGSAPLGSECWKVWINEVIDVNVPLYMLEIRCFDLKESYVEAATIAWPIKYVKIYPKPKNEKVIDYPSAHPNPSTTSPDLKNDDLEEQLDILNDDDDDGSGAADRGNAADKEIQTGIDINLPHQNDTDDEIADVDVSDDEVDKGHNAAEALRAQVNAEGRHGRTSSSSSIGSESSGSGSGSGSGSSRSDSESSDGDSVNSI